MINYNWDCKTVDVYPQKEEYTDVVFKVYWILTGEDENGITANISGIHSLDTSVISEFVPFENLTEEQVLGWIHTEMGEELIAQLKNEVNDRINEQITPSYITKIISA